MKTKLLLLITAFFLQFANAQMDDKFYYPNKVINPITIPHEEFSLKVEQDSITGVFFKKENPKSYFGIFSRSWRERYFFPKNGNSFPKCQLSSDND